MNAAAARTETRIRMAQLADIPAILALFADEVEAGLMLPRNEAEMQARISHWRVAEVNHEIIGCVSLVFFNPTLAEIRSLAVAKPYRQNGLGKKLVQAAVGFAEEAGVQQVLTLTRSPWVFEPLGFEKNLIQNFPAKVQQDCQLCPFIDNCDEVALLYSFQESDLNHGK
ncbi:MAG: GNAT family N-acetyltransferase [Anaerolineales bacterium]